MEVEMSNKKWIIQQMAKSKGIFLITTLLLILQASSEIMMTALQKYVIDDVFSAGNYEMLPRLLWILASIIIIYSILFTLVPYLTKKAETKVYYSLSKDLLGNLHRLSMEKIQDERTARYVQLMTSDTKKVSAFIGVDLFSGLRHSITILILISIIGAASLTVLVFVLALSAVYIIVAKKYAPNLRELSKSIEESRADLLIHMEEGISSTREVISFNHMKREQEHFNSLFAKYFKKVMNEGKLLNKNLAISGPLRWGVRLVVFGFGGYQLLQGNITLGIFVIIFQFSCSLIDEIHSLFLFVTHLSINLAYVDRVRSIQKEDQIIDGTVSLTEPIKEISFSNVSFSYSPTLPRVLSNININIPIGKKIAFVGSSGGGKSTISQLLIRFFEPTDGYVTVNGHKLTDIKREDWSKTISIVFQEPYLLPSSIKTNLLFGQEQDLEKVKYYCKAVMVDEIIEGLSEGYDTIIGERGCTLSGGQRQRLAIARALIRDTEILIFDEATSSLDTETERQVQQQIDKLREGKTTIIIAHRLSTIENADIIYVLDRGEIVGGGTHEFLLQQCEVYQKLNFMQDENESQENHRLIASKLMA
jgi:ABC-type multidrug transport system fused ATPase/permease subunit